MQVLAREVVLVLASDHHGSLATPLQAQDLLAQVLASLVLLLQPRLQLGDCAQVVETAGSLIQLRRLFDPGRVVCWVVLCVLRHISEGLGVVLGRAGGCHALFGLGLDT